MECQYLDRNLKISPKHDLIIMYHMRMMILKIYEDQNSCSRISLPVKSGQSHHVLMFNIFANDEDDDNDNEDDPVLV